MTPPSAELRNRKIQKGGAGAGAGAITNDNDIAASKAQGLSSVNNNIVTDKDDHEHGLYRLTPLIQYGPLRRLDVGPFAFVYLMLIGADWHCQQQRHQQQDSQTMELVVTVVFGVVLLCHASLVMVSQWNMLWRVFVGYSKAKLPRTVQEEHEKMDQLHEQWTHCFVEPLHSTGTSCSSTGSIAGSGIATITRDAGGVLIVNFQNHIFRYRPSALGPDADVRLWTTTTWTNQEKGTTPDTTDAAPAATSPARFRPLYYPVNLPLQFYATWKGHESIAQMTLASQIYGNNTTIIELPSFFELLSEQLIAPFFLFQIFCVVLWSLDEYWYYAIFTLFALIMFESTLAYNRQQSLQRLHRAANTNAHFKCWVRRETGILHSTNDKNNNNNKNGSQSNKNNRGWMLLPKSELVPGDYVSLSTTTMMAAPFGNTSEGTPVPADILLLQGSAVCDEALLTGESVPQLKQALDTTTATAENCKNNSILLDLQDNQHKESILFGGTHLLVANVAATTETGNDNDLPSTLLPSPPPPDKGITGMVLRTGFETTQGNLLRSMAHSARTADGGIHTLDTLVFILLLIACALGAAALVLNAGWHDERRNRFRLVLHVIIIVTSVVPPELPMELSLAVTNSVAALVQRSQVYCSELFRIPWAGQVNVCCFDKTGTLTSDEMRLRGIRLPDGKDDVVHHDEEAALKQPDDVDFIEDIPRETMRVMIACHSLTPTSRLAGGGRRPPELMVVGDPLEQAVLKVTGYRMLGSNVVAPLVVDTLDGTKTPRPVTILHRFAFSSKLKRMTVLVIEEGGNDKQGEVWALSKGAPETMKQLMTPASIPDKYDAIAFYHMSLGRRVLAMASRRIKGSGNGQATVAKLKAKGRQAVERDLGFAGFLVLDCPLKPDSKAIIGELVKTKHIFNVMITGDAILTAVEVARQVGIIRSRSGASGFVVYRIQLKTQPQDGDGDAFPEFECLDIKDKAECRLPFTRGEIPKLRKLQQDNRAAFSIAGDVLVRMAQAIMLTGGSSSSSLSTNEEKALLLHPAVQEFLSEVVPLISVFARHAPHQKEAVVAAFNYGGFSTLMVGDGTNDVGALKRAHVGISIISAPEVEAKQRNASNVISQINKGAKKGKKNKSQGKQQRKLFEESLEQLREAQEELDRVELGDASVAAPFTSRAVSIKCVKDVIQQGRCTLVTMLQIYKILGINCLVNAMVLSILFLFGVKQGDRQLTILGIAVATLFYFVTRAEPLPTLSPTAPPSSVLCMQALVSIAMQFGVHLAAIAVATHAALVFVDPYDPSLVPDGPFNPNVLNTCTFMLTCVATINTFAVNYRGRPFMKDLHENKLMYRSLQVCYAVLAVCALEIFLPLNDLMQLTALPNVQDRILFEESSGWLISVVEATGFPLFIFGLGVADTVLAFAVERFARRYL